MVLILPFLFLIIYKYCEVTILDKQSAQDNCCAQGTNDAKSKYLSCVKAESLFRASILYQVVILIVTNVLSICKALIPIVDFVVLLLVLLAFAFLYGKNKNANLHGDNVLKRDSVFLSCKKYLTEAVSGTDRILIVIMLVLMGVLSLFLLFGAIFTVPYNYDSMTYHLARIGYWIDHQSVAHYVTNVDRQIYSPVLAEYNLLHVMLLAGNDTFTNIFQYICLFMGAYFIYHSAIKLKTNKVCAMFGAFAFMMMPLSISQSITTQNDLFAALIFILFVYKLIDLIQYEAITLQDGQICDIAMLGLTVAFAYLEKTSVCASMLFFMPWLLIVRLRKKDSFVKLLQSVGIAIASIVAPISETLIRTYLSSHSLMTDTASGDIMVATKNVKYIIVNILKNYSMLITQNYYRPLNGFVYRIAIGLGQKWNVEVNNEAIAFHGFDFLHHMNMGEDMYSHDKTPSAFVAYLALLAGVALVVYSIKTIVAVIKMKQIMKSSSVVSKDEIGENAVIKDTVTGDLESIGFAISAWLSFGFIMALLRWQPWGTRLMYPALCVTVIMSCNLLWQMTKRCQNTLRTGILSVLIFLTTVLAIPSVSYNLQPAVEFAKSGCQNRINQYFRANHREDGYEKLISLAQEDGAKDIGLIISGDGFDYPLWVMLRKDYPDAKLRHIIVEDAKKPGQKAPDCIFYIERGTHELGETFEYAGVTYTCSYVNDPSFDSYFRAQ